MTAPYKVPSHNIFEYIYFQKMQQKNRFLEIGANIKRKRSDEISNLK